MSCSTASGCVILLFSTMTSIALSRQSIMTLTVSACVAHDVRQRLLHDAVNRRFDLGRQALLVHAANDQVNGQPVAVAVVGHVTLERRRQPQVVEGAGPKLPRQTVHLLQRFAHDLAQVLGMLCDLGGVVLFEGAQADEQRGQGLARAVMQLPRDAAALLLLRRDDAVDVLRAARRGRRVLGGLRQGFRSCC